MNISSVMLVRGVSGVDYISRICMQESHIFQQTDKKIWLTIFIKISGFVGDRKADIMTVLRGFDKGILSGEGGN